MSKRSLRTAANLWSRKLHRWATVATAVPLLVVIVSGILLQLKKEITWVQPPTPQGAPGDPAVCMTHLLAMARSVDHAGVDSWSDVTRVDLHVDRRVVKVMSRSGWEIQVCAVTGTLLGSAIRRSDLIEALHDGSWFGSVAKLGIFLPSAVLVLVLWLTGVWLWFLPHVNRWLADRRDASARLPRS
ncbi:MAG: PepSY domain-containing protein [Phycisphaerales bacterium]|nr:PepSY domain-containing protein [Phycisphaerales bacterium]